MAGSNDPAAYAASWEQAIAFLSEQLQPPRKH
jgi:hypothetical protein